MLCNASLSYPPSTPLRLFKPSDFVDFAVLRVSLASTLDSPKAFSNDSVDSVVQRVSFKSTVGCAEGAAVRTSRVEADPEQERAREKLRNMFASW